MGGGFPIELILFAMIAAFLVLRLRSVLGRRTGFERPPAPEARNGNYDPRGGRVLEGEAQEVRPAAPQGEAAKRVVPDPRTPPGQALARIAAADRNFQPERFLDGAESAFRMVIQAFATGDRQTLRALLSDETYGGFEQAITTREQAGEQQRTELRAVHELAIEEADLRGSVADVTVRFVTDQINMTVGRGGEVVAGSDAITELTDLWTFQRDLTSADPTWKLVATRSL
ncbi:Tim44/TimA family putative adaptor protein [Siccirubricoccus phaeus]|uniref:Tim44/TimA family putative adaptor protein n=1 Tax=Siccirubricoccus phaeus TaxID=2595053 RepID=UPI0011F1ED67|nr:Tim44/TimA family putative adaptor protein [Siccirubricoccus phaeus]